MDTADRVLGHVPALRRHARLLCGSQDLGDEYVQVCLELVAEEPERLDQDDLNASLFRLFHSVWTLVNARLGTAASPHEGADPADRLEKGLQELAPLDRPVLLLTALEGLPLATVADILNLDINEAEAALERARRHLSRWSSAAILIVEDESIIAFELESLAKEMGHRVVGTARREREALLQALDTKPDLVLADIQLADHDSGIAAVRHILEHIDVPVIFVTGFPERLLTGGDTEPAFVIAKPYDPEGLKSMIGHVLAMHEGAEFAARHRRELIGKLSDIVARERAADSSALSRGPRAGDGNSTPA
jgi:DNA-directed RNA polymerase specialized sigma24 family protein